MQTTHWLTDLGNQELELIKRLGHDHPKTVAARNRFRDAYQAVRAIRRSYEAPAQLPKEDDQ